MVNYEFSALCREQGSHYIFQFIKGRRLSAIYHAHDFYELVCFLRGNGTQTVNGTAVHCEERSVTLLSPGDRHCFTAQSEDTELISLSVCREEFEALAGIYRLPHSNVPLYFSHPRISHLYDLCQAESAVTEYDCRLLLSSLLHACLQAGDAARRAQPAEPFFAAVEEMKRPENLKMGVGAFVSLSNYSHSHLARLVKKHFGMTPNQYVTELRLQRAYSDLVWTHEPAEAIAQELGFSSYSHFYRIFKSRFALSPAALRKGENAAELKGERHEQV